MLNRDFRDLFAAFNDAGVKYLVVGAHAVAFYSEPRFTRDLDVWVEATPENARRVMEALTVFGAPLEGVGPGDFATAGVTLQIGVAPNRIDVTTSIDGVSFEQAWPGRVTSQYGDQTIFVIARRDLVANKRAAGRPQDLLDLAALERHEDTPDPP
ncbi:MAG: hypothetical protein QN178_17640 [Armatimonadota bacterium]|nr:hypothetical protein [Armatimonadota bacterium]